MVISNLFSVLFVLYVKRFNVFLNALFENVTDYTILNSNSNVSNIAIVSEIMLESFLKRFGSQNYASGVLKIASVRGNKELKSASTDFGNKVHTIINNG